MTTNIKFVDAEESAYDAIEKMVDRRIRSLVVRFNKKNVEHGVITARDVVFKVLAKGLDPKKIRVSDIASKPILSIEQSMSIKEVAVLMERSNIARIFVEKSKNIIGVVSMIDLMDASLIMRARGKNVF
mgnify:CR=1 FL=1